MAPPASTVFQASGQLDFSSVGTLLGIPPGSEIGLGGLAEVDGIEAAAGGLLRVEVWWGSGSVLPSDPPPQERATLEMCMRGGPHGIGLTSTAPTDCYRADLAADVDLFISPRRHADADLPHRREPAINRAQSVPCELFATPV
jgi:hypothetical protein